MPGVPVPDLPDAFSPNDRLKACVGLFPCRRPATKSSRRHQFDGVSRSSQGGSQVAEPAARGAAHPFPTRRINSLRRSTLSQAESAILGILAGPVALMPFCADTDTRPRGQTISELRHSFGCGQTGGLWRRVRHGCSELGGGPTGVERAWSCADRDLAASPAVLDTAWSRSLRPSLSP